MGESEAEGERIFMGGTWKLDLVSHRELGEIHSRREL